MNISDMEYLLTQIPHTYESHSWEGAFRAWDALGGRPLGREGARIREALSLMLEAYALEQWPTLPDPEVAGTWRAEADDWPQQKFERGVRAYQLRYAN